MLVTFQLRLSHDHSPGRRYDSTHQSSLSREKPLGCQEKQVWYRWKADSFSPERVANTLLSHSWTHVVYCREVKKWTGSRLNPWLKLSFEILRQAAANLLLASLSSFFAFVVVYLALFYAQFFCVLPYDHSMRCNCLSRTIFCL